MFGDDAPRAATALASVQAKRTPQSTNPEAVRVALGRVPGRGSSAFGIWQLHSARLRDLRPFSIPTERNAPGEFMQQRRLRLGDILDDYCPRERRITNHVVVAMIEDDVKQTRCSTCDAEHEYKQAKAPAPRRKKAGALQEVLEDARPRAVAAPAARVPRTPRPSTPHQTNSTPTLQKPGPSRPLRSDLAATDAARSADADRWGRRRADERPEDDGPVHRRLIRATLPRPEGQVPERKEPDFTMRQPGARGERQSAGPAARAWSPAGAAGTGPQRWPESFRWPSTECRCAASRIGRRARARRPGSAPGQPSWAARSHRGGGGARPAGQNRGPGRGRKRGR